MSAADLTPEQARRALDRIERDAREWLEHRWRLHAVSDLVLGLATVSGRPDDGWAMMCEWMAWHTALQSYLDVRSAIERESRCTTDDPLLAEIRAACEEEL